MTARHVLEEWTTCAEQRQLFWSTPTLFKDKLSGEVNNLKWTAVFFIYVYIKRYSG